MVGADELVARVLRALAPAPAPESSTWPMWWASAGRWVAAALQLGVTADEAGAAAAVCTGLARLGAQTSPEHAALQRLHAEGVIGAEVVEAHGLALRGLAGAPAPVVDHPAAPDGWRSPAEIAAALGVSAQRVGRLITELGLRDSAEAQARLTRAPSGKTVTSSVYSPAAQRRIGAALDGSPASLELDVDVDQRTLPLPLGELA